MSVSQTLRDLVTVRLNAAAEDIFALFERTIAEYEEELRRKQQLLDNIHNPAESPGPDFTQIVVIKEELEEQSVSQEAEQQTEPEIITACMKTEENPQLQQGQTEHREETIISETLFHPGIENSSLCFKSNPTAETSACNHGDSSGAEGKKHPCSICGKRYSSQGNLLNHLRTHTGETTERSFSCSICEKAFSCKGNLKTHLITHAKRPFSCSICSKVFTTKSSLDNHTRLHTGEKPYSCPYCKKAFAENSNLKKHLRTHTGEKPYSCSICNRDFGHNSSLKSHMRSQHMENPELFLSPPDYLHS